MKRKSRTSCQPIALALGHSVLGDRKKSLESLWRSSIFPKMTMNTSARRGSLERLLLCRHIVMKWSSTKNHRSLLDLSGVDTGRGCCVPPKKKQNAPLCRGRTGKTQSLPKKGRLSSEKVDIWPQGKTFAGLLCTRVRTKRKKKSKIKNKKNKKNEAEKRGRSLIRRARGSPIQKTYRKLHGKSSLYRKTR